MGFEVDRILNKDEVDIGNYFCAKCQLCLEKPVRCKTCLKNFCYECINTSLVIKGEVVQGWCPVERRPVKSEDII